MACIFTQLNLQGFYNLVGISAGVEQETAFKTQCRHFEYAVMTFRLAKTPATFKHLINYVFWDLLDQFVIAYFDITLNFSEDHNQHSVHVWTVLERLHQCGLFTKLEKSSFDEMTIEFLGLVLSSTGLKMGLVQAIQEWKAPWNVKELQWFLWFVNFYHRFIASFAQIVSPLTVLLQKNVQLYWSRDSQQAFEHLKQALTSSPVLVHLDPALPFVVETDASSTTIVAVLPNGRAQNRP